MTFEELDLALARHGPELASWPAAERRAAEALLAAAPEARRALAGAAALDAAILEARATPVAAPAALLERVIADAAAVAAARDAARPKPAPAAPRPRWRLPELFRPALACAASALFGLWLGQSAMVAQAADGLLFETPAEAGPGGGELAMGYDEAPDLWTGESWE